MIYHLTTPETWSKAISAGTYNPDSILSEGFIHFSTEAQLLKSATLYYKTQDILTIVALDDSKLSPRDLKWEQTRDDQLFPHLYRAIDPNEVADTFSLKRDAKGKWVR